MDEEGLTGSTSGEDELYYEDDYSQFLWEKIVKDKEMYCAINFTLIHEYPPTGQSHTFVLF